MRKLLLISAMLLLWAGSSWGQVATTYSFTQTAGTYTEITDGTVIWSGTFDDNISAAITIPSFVYDGVARTSLFISANGFMTFGIAPLGGNYAPISNTATYAGAIAAFGRDLNHAAAGSPSVSYKQVGNEFVIQWTDVRRYNIANERISFQIRLNTANNSIQVVYGGTIVSGSSLTYPQVGLRGPNNTFATNVNNRSILAAGGDWINSAAGTSNTSTMYFNSATPGTIPSAGLTYTWAPITFFPPSNFIATTASADQIDLSWNLNLNGDGVMIIWNLVNTFGTPTGTYNVGDPIAGGGTVLYIGNGTAISHSSLEQNTTYYYRAFSVDGSNYTIGVSASAKTLCLASNTPFVENFELATFPPDCWSLIAGSGNWNRQTGVSAYGIGTACTRANFYGISGTVPFDLITIGFNLPLAKLEFDHAYATYTAGENDQLFIFYSTNGGVSYTQLALLNGGFTGELVTAPPTGGSFVPTAAQWATKTFLLPAGTNKVKFQAKSAFGNNLYIDNIKVDELPTVPEFSITPSSWDFGTVEAQGTPATKVFTVKNQGGGILMITDISITPGVAAPNEFTLVNPPASIELGLFESTTLTVAFSPNSPGARTATLNLNSNVRVERTVELSGAGIDLTGALLFAQDPKYSGDAITSTYNPPTFDYEGADNFWGIEGEIARFAFYGLFLTTPAPFEPFFIRFYEFNEGYVPGLVAQETGTYNLALKDSWGDGWNGGMVSVFVNGLAILTDITLQSGNGPEYHNFAVVAGDEISTIYTPGQWSGENYYAILDPDDNIMAEQGGTWATPGATTPGNINPGSIQPLEPDWNNPVSSQYVYVSPLPIGTNFAGYPVYKLIGDLQVPVNMSAGWFSAQFDAVTGTPTIFYWLPGLDGDGLSHQRTTATRQTYGRGENDPSILSSKEGERYSRGQRNDDRAFELLGPSVLIPLSNWALYLGIFLITVFVVIRFRRMI